jgi:hypothetical protein
LLDFSFKLYVFILGDVVSNFEIAELVLKVFLLHFSKVIDVLIVWVLFLPKNHFSSKLFTLYLLKSFTLTELSAIELGITHQYPSRIDIPSRRHVSTS